MRSFFYEFKTPIVTIVLIFLSFLIYTKVFGPIPFYINSVNTTKTDLFSASGSGKETAVPDTATINVGVTKQAATVETAKEQVNTVASTVIADLKKLGIKDRDIKTTNYSVNPDYGSSPRPLPASSAGSEDAIIAVPPTYYGGDQQIVGYTVTQNIEVKVKPIENVNKAIDTATKDGANLLYGATFTFSDEVQKNLEQKATQAAVDDAKQNAKTLSDAAGIRLGRIINVVSSANNNQPVYPMSAKAEDVGSTPTQVTPGENTVEVGVTIYYETY